MTQAYGVFKDEAQTLSPYYSPLTATTDGWAATKNALMTLFPTMVLIQCFLHLYIKLRDRSKRKSTNHAYKTWFEFDLEGRAQQNPKGPC